MPAYPKFSVAFEISGTDADKMQAFALYQKVFGAKNLRIESIGIKLRKSSYCYGNWRLGYFAASRQRKKGWRRCGGSGLF